MTTWYRAHNVSLERSAGWTYARNLIVWLLSLGPRTAFWLNTHWSQGGLGAVAFIHKELETARYPIKSGQKIFCLCRTSPSVDVRTHTRPWVPNTLVGSQLHQMHLKHPTWFNGVHYTWCNTNGGRSLTDSIMLKRSPGSKVGCLAPPSSCLRDLLQHLISLLGAAASELP